MRGVPVPEGTFFFALLFCFFPLFLEPLANSGFVSKFSGSEQWGLSPTLGSVTRYNFTRISPSLLSPIK